MKRNVYFLFTLALIGQTDAYAVDNKSQQKQSWDEGFSVVTLGGNYLTNKFSPTSITMPSDGYVTKNLMMQVESMSSKYSLRSDLILGTFGTTGDCFRTSRLGKDRSGLSLHGTIGLTGSKKVSVQIGGAFTVRRSGVYYTNPNEGANVDAGSGYYGTGMVLGSGVNNFRRRYYAGPKLMTFIPLTPKTLFTGSYIFYANLSNKGHRQVLEANLYQFVNAFTLRLGVQYGAEKMKGSHLVSMEGPTFMDVKGSSLCFYSMIGFAFQ